MKNTGFGYLHFTMSAWDSPADAKVFAHSGAHLLAMKQAGHIATEVRIHTFEGESLPSWTDAKKVVQEKGRLFQYK